jgi:hypothetical protein
LDVAHTVPDAQQHPGLCENCGAGLHGSRCPHRSRSRSCPLTWCSHRNGAAAKAGFPTLPKHFALDGVCSVLAGIAALALALALVRWAWPAPQAARSGQAISQAQQRFNKCFDACRESGPGMRCAQHTRNRHMAAEFPAPAPCCNCVSHPTN